VSDNVHKILVLRADIISGAILPIGQLSEKTYESRNKHLNNSGEVIRGKHLGDERKNEHVFNLLLVSSDPISSSLRKPPK
jgi:hypothetical protein